MELRFWLHSRLGGLYSDHCYAVRQTYRLEHMGHTAKYGGLTVLNGKGDRHFNGLVKCHEDALEIPLRWRKPRMVFVDSMSDLFHRDVPFEFIDKVFAVMALCPQHTFQVLTKRPERMAEYLSDTNRINRWWRASHAYAYPKVADQDWPWCPSGEEADDPHAMPTNVMLGTSVENQESADKRIPHLLRCPAAVRFLSCEPLLGAIYVDGWFGEIDAPRERWPDCTKELVRRDISWVIIGGESGPGARLCDIGWIRSIRDQCKAAGVPCFVKQLGKRIIVANDSSSEWPRDGDEWIYPADTPVDYQGESLEIQLKDPKGGDPSEWPEDLKTREFPNV